MNSIPEEKTRQRQTINEQIMEFFQNDGYIKEIPTEPIQSVYEFNRSEHKDNTSKKQVK